MFVVECISSYSLDALSRYVQRKLILDHLLANPFFLFVALGLCMYVGKCMYIGACVRPIMSIAVYNVVADDTCLAEI